MMHNNGTPQPPSTVNNESEGFDESGDPWMQRARDAYFSSTSYVDSNYRKKWEDSIRAFNNQHPQDSKYNSPAYDKRSKVYRPKARSVIRKTEAAGATAFFSNQDVVSIEATNQGKKEELASAEVMKELLQYRLTKSIPWFMFVLGGLQDAQTTGAACAYIYWDYKEAKGKRGEDRQADNTSSEYPAQPGLSTEGAVVESSDIAHSERASQGNISNLSKQKPLSDKPCVELIPIENLRIDPAASWIDPVNTSPYIIHLMPMYVGDVREKMDAGDWNYYDDEIIKQAIQDKSDSTNAARQGDQRQSPYQNSEMPVSDYQIVWVHRHIHRKGGQDYIFYTLSDVCMLTDPIPLEEEFFHGMRPFVIGKCILETHKVLSSSVPELTSGISQEINEIANQRIDNVKFVLNKKWFIKRSGQVDVSGLMRNVPGGAVMMNDPEKDVREINFPDVTSSSFQEQNNLNADFDELAGNFSSGSVTTNKTAMESPMRTMSMLNQGANAVVEYTLRTYVETFLLPVLGQLVRLEQIYETDDVILALAADKAQLFQKYGMNEVTDSLLNKDLTIKVNVGMGATDPQMKLQKFIAGVTAFTAILKEPVPGLNKQEVGKEIFGHLGYQDGKRFMMQDDPEKAQMQMMMQQAGAQLMQLQKELKDKQTDQMLEHKKMQLDYDAKLKKLQEDYAKEVLKQHGKVIDLQAKGHQEQFKAAQQQHMQREQHFLQSQSTEKEAKEKDGKSDKSLQELKSLMKEIASAVMDMKQQMEAPKVIKRDKEGRAIAINDRPLERDAKGNITRMQ